MLVTLSQSNLSMISKTLLVSCFGWASSGNTLVEKGLRKYVLRLKAQSLKNKDLSIALEKGI